MNGLEENIMGMIAIITARGGSKRIPKKNIKEFCGKPIIAYSIEAALKSGLFDEVMVSTDSDEIADIARKYGANVPFMRSEFTSGDFATTEDVLNEVLDEYAKLGRHFEYMCCIYPTAPFVTAKKLTEASEYVTNGGFDAVYPVVAFSFPPQRSFINADGVLKWKWPEYKDSRSQDLETFYHDSGQFYFYRTESFTDKKNSDEMRIAPYVLPETEVQDIDNIEDWELAEIKYKYLKDHGVL
jgi:N-acylneuraminate cytidylyltransferase